MPDLRNTLLFSSLILACSTNNDLNPIRESFALGGTDGQGGADTRGGAASGGASATSGGSSGSTSTQGGASGGSGAAGCGPGPDADADGFAVAEGDCNDCNPAQNPGAFDFPGNGVDEDCSGAADDEVAVCDDGLSEDGDAFSAARALGLCRRTTVDARGKDRSWGLIAARYVFPDGTTASLEADAEMDCPVTQSTPNDFSHGIVSQFGSNVAARQGSSMVVLSSGVARAGVQPAPGGWGLSPAGAFMCTRSLAPDGFPASSYTTCGDSLEPNDEGSLDSIYDAIALELVIRVPTNATSFGFDLDFYTYEYPDFPCSATNDAFAAFLLSAANGLAPGRNIAADADGNPIGINSAFLEVCEPSDYYGTRGGAPFVRSFTCPLGTSELDESGFAGELDGLAKGATSWLRTRASVSPGEEITLRLAIWDAGEEWYDSTVLLDHFEWDAAQRGNTTTRPAPGE